MNVKNNISCRHITNRHTHTLSLSLSNLWSERENDRNRRRTGQKDEGRCQTQQAQDLEVRVVSERLADALHGASAHAKGWVICRAGRTGTEGK